MIFRPLILSLFLSAFYGPAFSETPPTEGSEYFEILEGTITDKDFDSIKAFGACYKSIIEKYSKDSDVGKEAIKRFEAEEKRIAKEIYDLKDKKEIIKAYDSLIGLLSIYKRTTYQVLISTPKGQKQLDSIIKKYPVAKNDSDVALALLLSEKERLEMKTCLSKSDSLTGSNNRTQTNQLYKERDKVMDILSDPIDYLENQGITKVSKRERAKNALRNSF